MTEFNELLGEIIGDENITLYSLAKETMVDRTLISKVIKGERTFNYDSFISIYMYLKNIIDSEISKELYERFSYDFFGKEEMSIIHFIMNRMIEMGQNEEKIRGFKGRNVALEDCLKDEYSSNECKLIKAVYNLISEELIDSQTEKRNARLWVSIPSEWAFLRNMILYLITQEEYNSKYDFKYYFRGLSIKGKMDIELLQDYLTASEFAQYGFNLFKETKCNEVSEAEMIPYYIITQKGVLLIFHDGSIMVNRDKEIIDKMSEVFLKLVTDKESFLEESDGINYKKEILKEISDDGVIESIGNVVNIENFINNYGGLNKKTYFTLDSIIDFMNNAKSKSDYKKRLEILNEILKEIEEQKMEISIMYADKIKYLSTLNVLLVPERFLISICVMGEEDKKIERVSFLSSPLIYKHLRNYSMYIRNSQFCIDSQESIKMFRMMVKGFSKKDFV